MISRDFILVETRLAASETCPRRRRGKLVSTEQRLVLRRALRLGRGCASGELLQAVAFVARRGPNHGVILRHFHYAVRHLECLRIFSLLIQCKRQTQNVHGSRVAGVCVDGLLQILLRGSVILFLVINGADDRVGLRAQSRLVGVDFLLGRARRDAYIGVNGLQSLLRHRGRFAETLIFVDIRVARSLGNHLGDHYQSLGIVPVQAEYLAAHGLGLLGVVRILVESHRVLIEQYANFAIGELGGEIVRCLLQRGNIGACRCRLPGIELRLGLGLRWTLSQWWHWRPLRGRRLPRRRRVLLGGLSALALGPNRDTRYRQTQYP